jgi:hypothetical protein
VLQRGAARVVLNLTRAEASVPIDGSLDVVAASRPARAWPGGVVAAAQSVVVLVPPV